jgi:putative Mg2+ transporter-C (MgtC) family protein
LLIDSFNADYAGSQVLRSDPLRIIEATIVGVSFLGAGVIFRREGHPEVKGLTTGASLLFSAGLGIAVALSQFILAIGGALLVLFVTRVLGIIEKRWM